MIYWLIIFQIFGSLQLLTTISVVGIQGSSVGCDVYEFDLQANATVDIESSTYAELSGKSNVYFQITFTSNLGTQYSTDFRLGPYDFEGNYHWCALNVNCMHLWQTNQAEKTTSQW